MLMDSTCRDRSTAKEASLPDKTAWGWPVAVYRTSTSRKVTPSENPTPKALTTASLAAHMPAARTSRRELARCEQFPRPCRPRSESPCYPGSAPSQSAALRLCRFRYASRWPDQIDPLRNRHARREFSDELRGVTEVRGQHGVALDPEHNRHRKQQEHQHDLDGCRLVQRTQQQPS